MRFQKHINENEFNILGFIYLTDEVNEMADETFQKIQKLGHKMGLKVRKSKTFQNQMAKAGTGVLQLMKLVFHYAAHADIMDKVALKKVEGDIKSQFSKVKKEDVISFIVNLDKTFLGITSIPRHVLQNLLGITVTSYDNWATNQDYVEKNMQKIISVLHDMGDTEDEELAKRIYQNVIGKVA